MYFERNYHCIYLLITKYMCSCHRICERYHVADPDTEKTNHDGISTFPNLNANQQKTDTSNQGQAHWI